MERLALLSVTDKTGLADFAKALLAMGWRLLSTGGTAAYLRDHALPVTDVAAYAGSPEILGGRVKTLHPKIHGGILLDPSNETHLGEARTAGIAPIEMVVVNLYQFQEKVILNAAANSKDPVEYIDIGGPTMLRGAAKNFRFCLPVIDPRDYDEVTFHLQQGNLPLEFRQRLAAKVFQSISNYDEMISKFLENSLPSAEPQQGLPKSIVAGKTTYERTATLRYGENPHQKASFLENLHTAPSVLKGVIQGKELSYNNLLDLDAAVNLAMDLGQAPACAIIKHTNPCGVAVGQKKQPLSEVFARALAADTKSAFGGIVALTRPVDELTAEKLASIFLECVAAPAFDADALKILAAKKNLRLLDLPALSSEKNQQNHNQGMQLRSALGGILAQQADTGKPDADLWRVVTKKSPSPAEKESMIFAMTVAKHAKSNAIVYAKSLVALAVGCGQTSRIDAATQAAAKATANIGPKALVDAVMASDAFFPFRDTVDLAAKYGVSAIIQPGGSVKDDESIAAADEAGIAMVFTGQRHFRH